jgi:hypothetical protein
LEARSSRAASGRAHTQLPDCHYLEDRSRWECGRVVRRLLTGSTLDSRAQLRLRVRLSSRRSTRGRPLSFLKSATHQIPRSYREVSTIFSSPAKSRTNNIDYCSMAWIQATNTNTTPPLGQKPPRASPEAVQRPGRSSRMFPDPHDAEKILA